MRVQPHISLKSTRALTSAERDDLVALAETRGVPATFLRPRLGQYPLVARFGDGDGVSAFQLVERHETPRRSLIYLGPLVSRSRAYLPLFAGLVARMLSWGRAFSCAAEFENMRIFNALGELMPTRSWPGQRGGPSRASATATLREFAQRVRHMEDFDEETLTTRMREPNRPDGGPGRYLLGVFGSDGTRADRWALRTELNAGLLRLGAPTAVAA